MWQHDMFEVTDRLVEAEQRRKCFAPARINLSNLHCNVSERDLYDLFSVIGKLDGVSIDYDNKGRPLGTSNARNFY